jgi:hypothetical protein
MITFLALVKSQLKKSKQKKNRNIEKKTPPHVVV